MMNKILRSPTKQELADFKDVFAENVKNPIEAREQLMQRMRQRNRKRILTCTSLKELQLSCQQCFYRDWRANQAPTDFEEAYDQYLGLKFHSVQVYSQEKFGKLYEEISLRFTCPRHNFNTAVNIYVFKRSDFEFSDQLKFFEQLKNLYLADMGEEVEVVNTQPETAQQAKA